MARGVRKSPVEKLNEELFKTREEIQNHKDVIKMLQEKEKQIESEIQAEEFKEVSAILQEKNISIAELKNILISKEEHPQDE